MSSPYSLNPQDWKGQGARCRERGYAKESPLTMEVVRQETVDAGSVTSRLRVCAMHRNALKCAEIPACAGMR